MTLESKLFELTTLVDYGTYYLQKASYKSLGKTDPTVLLDCIGPRDIAQYLINSCWEDEVLDRMDTRDIQRYVHDHNRDYCIDEIFPVEDIKEYVRDNWCVDEVFTEDDIVDYVNRDYCINEIFPADDIKEYVRDNWCADEVFDEDDIVDWVKDRFDVDELIETDMRWR